MDEVEFVCKVITLAFYDRRDGKTSELKPSKFKKMVRFGGEEWGPRNNIENLRKEKAKPL